MNSIKKSVEKKKQKKTSQHLLEHVSTFTAREWLAKDQAADFEAQVAEAEALGFERQEANHHPTFHCTVAVV